MKTIYDLLDSEPMKSLTDKQYKAFEDMVIDVLIPQSVESERKQLEREIEEMTIRKNDKNTPLYEVEIDNYNMALQDVLDLLKKETKNICLNCGRELKPDKTTLNFTTKKWDGHTYKCKCMPKLRISIG